MKTKIEEAMEVILSRLPLRQGSEDMKEIRLKYGTTTALAAFDRLLEAGLITSDEDSVRRTKEARQQ